jgi:GT2 family glycosyltransferase
MTSGDPRVSAEGAQGAPAVSVVMPVHNALPYLGPGVASILGQTFAEFEFIILDDASTDGSTEELREWASRDARIRLFETRGRLGPAGSSNFVVREARAPFVARMDADDVAHPERLARQVEVLRSSPDVVLVAALCDGINADGRSVRPRDRWRLVRSSLFPPFPHGSAVFRRAAFDAAGGYREECALWEDQDLFLRMRRAGRVVVLPEVLYHYRYHVSNSASREAFEHVARQYGAREELLRAFRRGRDGDGAGEGREDATAEALYHVGTMRLWAGRRPAILRQALRPGALGLDERSVLTLMLALWGSMSPSTLRGSLRGFLRARDFVAGRRVKDGCPCEWRAD